MSSPPTPATQDGRLPRDELDAFWDCLVGADGDRQRAYPRVRVNATIVVTVDGQDVPTRLHDVGRGGVQVRCDRASGARIDPGLGRKGRGPGPVSLTLRGTLPDGAGQCTLEARCALVHATRVRARDRHTADDQLALGFRFEQLDPATAQSLERFILNALEPAEA